jgi:hypothetical protein
VLSFGICPSLLEEGTPSVRGSGGGADGEDAGSSALSFVVPPLEAVTESSFFGAAGGSALQAQMNDAPTVMLRISR